MNRSPAEKPIQPPGTNPANATTSSRRHYDVRSADGRRFLFKVSAEHAARGIAEGVFVLAHARSGAYLKRTADRSVVQRFVFGSKFTRPVRSDGTCKNYAPGQLMGDPKRLREFFPSGKR
jgi:hypothetical protein